MALTTTKCVTDSRDDDLFDWLLGEGEIVADYHFVTRDDGEDDRLKMWEAVYEVTYGPRDEVLVYLAERAGCSFTPAA
jgi:hypothetical protein